MNAASDLVASASELAVLPSSYLRLTAALEAPGAGPEQISAAIRLDPALAARLLRLVNSPAYSPRRPVDSLGHAVALAGTSVVKRLALGSSLVRMFRGIPERLLDMKAFWTHSVAVAVGTVALASRVPNGPRGDSVFVAGLLHDLGTLLLCLRSPDAVLHVMGSTEDLPQDHLERELLGFSHADVGAQLLMAWGLPSPLVAAAGWHHGPGRVPAEFRVLVDLVHLADVMSSALRIGTAGERAAHRLDLGALERTGLGPDDFRLAAGQVEVQLQPVVEAMLG